MAISQKNLLIGGHKFAFNPPSHPADELVVRILRQCYLGVLYRLGHLWIGLVLCLGLVGPGAIAQTDETYPTLVVGPDTYTNVFILSKTRYDIFFKHKAGMGNAKVRDLDIATQMRLGYQVEPPKPNKITQVFQASPMAQLESDPRFQQFEEELVAQYGDFFDRLDQTVTYSIVAMVVLLYLLFSYLCRCICVKTSNPASALIWVPVFKQIPMFKAAGMSPWWTLSMFLPPVYLVAWLLWCFKIVQARGKKTIFSIMLLLPVTNVIAFFYLALSGDGSEQKDTGIINLSDANPPRAAA